MESLGPTPRGYDRMGYGLCHPGEETACGWYAEFRSVRGLAPLCLVGGRPTSFLPVAITTPERA